MKILHIDTGKEWRGGQRQVYLLHNTLLENGINSFLVANAKGILAQKAEQNVFALNYKNELDLNYVKNLLKIIKENQIDIIHSHDAHSLTPAIFCCFLNKKLKLIHTRRVDFSINKTIFSKLKYTNKRVTKIVAISNAIKNILINDGVNPKKIETIHSGVPLPKTEDKKNISKLKNEFDLNDKYVICCVANFAEHKDHKTLLKAFELINSKLSNIKLMLVGNGPLFEETKNFAQNLNCRENIVFTGYREDIYDLIRCANIFCITSKEEGLCTSIIDALNCGKPVVATKAGGIPELVEHDINGLLCEIKDYRCIAQNIISIYNDKEKMLFLSNNAIKKGQLFTEIQMSKKYIQLYNSII
jgi:glycosyltransferase involved in cell wall biosynthesis